MNTFPKFGYDPITGDWNDSLRGDYCWSSVNFREAAPDVMTPSTWSLFWIYIHETNPIHFPGNHPAGGNIAGRLYFNLSLISSLYHAVGMDARKEKFGDLLGATPPELNIPYLPLSPLAVIWNVLPGMIKDRREIQRDTRQFSEYITYLPDWCQKIRPRIQQCARPTELLIMWNQKLLPATLRSFRMLRSITTRLSAPATRLKLDLSTLAGETEANTLLSNFSGPTGSLESLKPLAGLAQVKDGTMSRDDYIARFGHRDAHGGELSAPGPEDDPQWLDKKLDVFSSSQAELDALLAKQHAEFITAWQRFETRFPTRAQVFRRRLALVTAAAQDREVIRSESSRLTRLIRLFLVQAGKVSDLGSDVFFLTLDEILSLLAGDKSSLMSIVPRKTIYHRYCALPPYPAIIYGHFDPFHWAADPNRRSDFYDVRHTSVTAQSTAIKGFAGAAGCVTGLVRRIDRIEDANQVQQGEILVTCITNIGWTPLFPRLAAIVTDVGAPLSHAAIVARELGIPAVVGCGNATMRLKTGDRVRVDGGKGTVDLLSE